jgi:acyl carrier protein
MQQSLEQAQHHLRAVMMDTLGVSSERAEAFGDDTPLFGALPELDSMAVATVLTDIEDRTGIVIDDDEVEAEMFETFGNLVRFIAAKLDSARAA